MSIQSVTRDSGWLSVNYTDGLTQKYLATWLRDNIDTGRHLSHGQRTFDLNLMDRVSITEATCSGHQLKIRFDHEASYHYFDEAWLRGFSNDGPGIDEKTLWGTELQTDLEFFDFDLASTDDDTLLALLSRVDQFGFALVENLIAACLMHDVGHWLDEPDDEYGIHSHCELGGDWVAERFGPKVSEPVRLHVEAKRYLCSVDPSYHDHLSPASVYTLSKQGGPMSDIEVTEFTTRAYFEDACKLRRLEDDFGKLAGIEEPSLDRYETLLLKLS